MDLFVDILTRVTLPIITLVALGWALQGRLKLDVATLNRIQVYVVMPAFLIHFLSSGKQPLSVIWPVVYFGLVQFLILIPLGWLLVILFRQRASLGPIMGLGHGLRQCRLFRHPGDAARVRVGVPDLSVGADGADGRARVYRRRRDAGAAGRQQVRQVQDGVRDAADPVGHHRAGVARVPDRAADGRVAADAVPRLDLYAARALHARRPDRGGEVAAAGAGAADADPVPEIHRGAGDHAGSSARRWGCRATCRT